MAKSRASTLMDCFRAVAAHAAKYAHRTIAIDGAWTFRLATKMSCCSAVTECICRIVKRYPAMKRKRRCGTTCRTMWWWHRVTWYRTRRRASRQRTVSMARCCPTIYSVIWLISRISAICMWPWPNRWKSLHRPTMSWPLPTSHGWWSIWRDVWTRCAMNAVIFYANTAKTAQIIMHAHDSHASMHRTMWMWLCHASIWKWFTSSLSLRPQCRPYCFSYRAFVWLCVSVRWSLVMMRRCDSRGVRAQRQWWALDRPRIWRRLAAAMMRLWLYEIHHVRHCWRRHIFFNLPAVVRLWHRTALTPTTEFTHINQLSFCCYFQAFLCCKKRARLIDLEYFRYNKYKKKNCSHSSTIQQYSEYSFDISQFVLSWESRQFEIEWIQQKPS